MRDFIRKITPTILLEAFRNHKKKQVNKALEQQKKAGNSITKTDLVQQLRKMGIAKGDSLMVHSAMSKIGHLEEGPKTLVDALLECVGPNGHLLMPSSPVKALQLEHIQAHTTFDVKNTPSAMGAVTEYFRKLPDVRRSAHPTEPVCVWGNEAEWFIHEHFGQISPYNLQSPWYKLMEKKGKILYIGVTLINSGTHLHVLEDLTDFKYPVYHEEIFNCTVIDENGQANQMITKVHNPEFSRRRKCDDLIPLFEKKQVLRKTKLGRANSLLLDAYTMLETMIASYEKDGVTMYTPHGEKINGYD